MAEGVGGIRIASYTEQAREAIQRMIFDGTYEPGARLKEAELSRMMGISRAPVREAVLVLAGEGLVRVEPQRGAFVATFDPDKIRELYEVREALEATAARLACERASRGDAKRLLSLLESAEGAYRGAVPELYLRDLGFHRGLCDLSGNQTLAESAARLHAQLLLARSRAALDPDRAQEVYEEHRRIAGAVARGDAGGAEAAVRGHLRNSLEITLAHHGDHGAGG